MSRCHHWTDDRCTACGLLRVTIRNGRGYPRTHFERDGARFRRTLNVIRALPWRDN